MDWYDWLIDQWIARSIDLVIDWLIDFIHDLKKIKYFLQCSTVYWKKVNHMSFFFLFQPEQGHAPALPSIKTSTVTLKNESTSRMSGINSPTGQRRQTSGSMIQGSSMSHLADGKWCWYENSGWFSLVVRVPFVIGVQYGCCSFFLPPYCRLVNNCFSPWKWPRLTSCLYAALLQAGLITLTLTPPSTFPRPNSIAPSSRPKTTTASATWTASSPPPSSRASARPVVWTRRKTRPRVIQVDNHEIFASACFPCDDSLRERLFMLNGVLKSLIGNLRMIVWLLRSYSIIHRQIDPLDNFRLIVWFIHWLIDWLIGWLILRLIVWNVWFMCLIYWLIDWLRAID